MENIIDANMCLDKNSILGWIISQNSVCYPTKDKKVIGKLDIIFIFEKIKKLSIAHGQGYYIILLNILYNNVVWGKKLK